MARPSVFNNKKVIFNKLQNFGFKFDGEIYTYCEEIVGGQFTLTVNVDADGNLQSHITDAYSGEEYILHLTTDAVGAFVGKVRTDYNNVLQKIADSCFESKIFKSETAAAVVHYVREKYGSELEFLWKTSPGNAILRRQDNDKWYAALLTVRRDRLGFAGQDMIEIINLRMDAEKIPLLLDHEKFFPAYHMNKKHWVSLCLDGSISAEKICHYIDDSYVLAKKR